MTYPAAIEIDGRAYPINTGYQHALACFACIEDPEITDLERAWGVLGLLYQEQPMNMDKAISMAVKYLQLGKEKRADPDEDSTRDLDFQQDMHYLRSSFRSDYGIDLDTDPGMHWWRFSELLQGLTDKCILNRVRDLRNYDASQVKDPQARMKIQRAQEDVALRTAWDDEDERRLDEFYSQLK